jgi:Right handed beta helix region
MNTMFHFVQPTSLVAAPSEKTRASTTPQRLLQRLRVAARWLLLRGRLLALPLATACPLGALACDGAFTTTGPAFCFLSEVGGCANLPAFLASHLPSFPVTLVVDQQCVLNQPLVLPGRMTLAGVGRDGNGELLFPNVGLNEAAISIAPGQGHVQIRDVLIRNNAPVPRGIGLNLDGNSLITLDSVRIDGFHIGVYGRQAFSVLIDKSNISNNRYNLYLGQQANTWRIRDTVLNQALAWGIVVRGPNNDVLVDGNRLESNQLGAIQVYSYATVVTHNRFESNGTAAQHEGVSVRPSAQETRVLTNYFSSDIITDAGTATRCALNSNVAEPGSCLWP